MHTNRHSPQSEGGAFVGLDWDLGRNPAKQALNGAQGAVVPVVSWPGLARPSTTGGADRGKDVDGRHKHALGRAAGPARGAGHDTGGAGPAKLAPMGRVPAVCASAAGVDGRDCARP